jgi:hypothetical protein
MGFMVPSYFSDKGGRNLGGQTTIRRCGETAAHLTPVPGELWECPACPTGAAFVVVDHLTLALDGDAVIFSHVAVLKLGAKVGPGKACHCRCAHHHRCV